MLNIASLPFSFSDNWVQRHAGPAIEEPQLQMDHVADEGMQPIPPARLLKNRRSWRRHHVIAGERPHRRRLQRHPPPIIPGERGRIQLPRRAQLPLDSARTTLFYLADLIFSIIKRPLYHAPPPDFGGDLYGPRKII